MMQKKFWQLTAAAVLGLGVLTMGSLPQAAAEQVEIQVLNHGGRGRIPETLTLETAEVPGYNQYVNRRFGFSVYIPAELDACFLPQNGDGASFTNGEAGIIAAGSHNAPKRTLEGEYEAALRQHPGASYKDHGDDWYVISYFYEPKDLIIYEKCFMNENYRNRLHISYPRVEQEYYGPMVEVVEASFVPGWKNQ